MTTYLGFLRGVNVGGKGLIKMSQLSEALTSAGFTDVRTYIQSGNILFSAARSDMDKLARQIKTVIEQRFKLSVEVVVFSKSQWQGIIGSAPKWWGKDTAWKHNLLILIPPFDTATVVRAIGELKPDIEALEAGDGVIYQSMSFKLFGRTTTGKLAKKAVYKNMTIRNYNTATKLLALLE